MPSRIVTVLRDAAIVVGVTFLGGLVVGASFDKSGHGTPLYYLSLNVVMWVPCSATFAVLAHIARANRFLHVWVVAVVASLPNLYWLFVRPLSIWPSLLVSVLLMLGYATVGAGLSYVFGRRRGASEPVP